MRSLRIAIPAVIAIAAFTACGDPTGTDTLYDDATVTQDVAASAGEDMSVMLGTMVDNEASVGGGAEAGGTSTSTLTVNRDKHCYDANNAVVTNCTPFSSVRTIVVQATIDGSRSSTRTKTGGTVTWTGAVHRAASDTARRIFVNTTETSRVHTNVATGHDTTTFVDDVMTRKLAETVLDSVKSLTFNLPRTSNPWPVSGSIVRHSAATVQISKDTKSVSKDITHRVEIDFPADAQGNVTLHIDAKTCQLNLTTHAVTNCQ